MYIAMYKLSEDKISVCYRIETTVFIDYKDYPAYGYCTFNKQTEKFTLDKEKTDPYLLVPDSRETMKAHMQLLRRAREGRHFEDLIQIASG